MPAPLTVSSWSAWRPDEYFRDYYSRQVDPDERAALRFQIEFLRRAGRRFPRALEYGCGPTLMRAIAAAPYVAALDMADRLPSNLAQVRRWISGHPDADSWRPFTRYILECEGSPPRISGREQQTRRAIADLHVTDALETHPLPPAHTAAYDLLISGFCVDCISQDRAVWRSAMRNVFSLLKPGGSFVIMALRGCQAYRVGDAWFPAADIQAGDLERVLLECGAASGSLEVSGRDLPSHRGQGYGGILLASGQTTGG